MIVYSTKIVSIKAKTKTRAVNVNDHDLLYDDDAGFEICSEDNVQRIMESFAGTC